MSADQTICKGGVKGHNSANIKATFIGVAESIE
jgi:hypothetical protein